MLPGHDAAAEHAAVAMLRRAEARIRIVRGCTPTNLKEELAALEHDYARGRSRAPAFRYRGEDIQNAIDPLARFADTLAARGRHFEIVAARARELEVEARILAAVNTPALRPLAKRRYGDGSSGDVLAEAWLKLDPIDEPEPHTTDDASDPQSLLSCMRAEVGRLRIGVKVRVAPLAALAAVGRGVVLVAEGRRMSAHAVARTVRHEVHGHALPRWRASHDADPLFDLGTAGGSDDQEGYALALEDEAGWLDDNRKIELARRHVAGRAVRRGSTFVETTTLLRDTAASWKDTLRIAARAHRAGGLAREVAYLPAFLRVAPVMTSARRPLLSKGRVAVRFLDALERRRATANAAGRSSPAHA